MNKSQCSSRKGTKSCSGASKKRSLKSRNVKNRYMQELAAESVGTSAKKIRLSKDNYDIDHDSTFGYRILCFATVFSALPETLVCHKCHKPVKFTEATKQGLGFKLVVNCFQWQDSTWNCCGSCSCLFQWWISWNHASHERIRLRLWTELLQLLLRRRRHAYHAFWALPLCRSPRSP